MPLQPTVQDSSNVINSLPQRLTWDLILFSPDADYRMMAAVVLTPIVPVLMIAVTVVSSLKMAPFEISETQDLKKTL